MSLFDEEEIHEDLHLMIAESPDESQTVVYGEVYVKFTVISDVCSACTKTCACSKMFTVAKIIYVLSYT